jgi:hypothetical protein
MDGPSPPGPRRAKVAKEQDRKCVPLAWNQMGAKIGGCLIYKWHKRGDTTQSNFIALASQYIFFTSLPFFLVTAPALCLDGGPCMGAKKF